jgi:hypothetical protein
VEYLLQKIIYKQEENDIQIFKISSESQEKKKSILMLLYSKKNNYLII